MAFRIPKGFNINNGGQSPPYTHKKRTATLKGSNKQQRERMLIEYSVQPLRGCVWLWEHCPPALRADNEIQPLPGCAFAEPMSWRSESRRDLIFITADRVRSENTQKERQPREVEQITCSLRKPACQLPKCFPSDNSIYGQTFAGWAFFSIFAYSFKKLHKTVCLSTLNTSLLPEG